MSYRKINIAGKTFEYVIGKSHTKIKGIGVFENVNIGSGVELHCECCGTGLNELYGEDPSHYALAVKPSDIKKCIENSIAV